MAGLPTEPHLLTGTVSRHWLRRQQSFETCGRSRYEVRRPAHNKVSWTQAVHGCFSDIVGCCDNKAVKIFGMINADTKQTLAMLRKSAATCLKNGRLTVVEILTFATSMKLDRVANWKPTKELLSQFALIGLQQVARAIDVNKTLAEAKLRETIQKEWPAGYAPLFLNRQFGIKVVAKTKGKAA